MIADEPERSGGVAGLRERKKQALRQQLSLAALRLAKERGLENVRVEDIVEAAGVSRRTFSNYFSNKYEAIVDRHRQRTELTADAVRESSPTEPLWETLQTALLAPFEAWAGAGVPPSDHDRATLRFVLGDPALRAEIAKGAVAAEAELTRAIAERTGTNPDRDLYPSLLATTVLAAQSAALDLWLRTDPPAPLLPFLRDALTQLAAGLPPPHEESR